MSGGTAALALQQDDVAKFLASSAHLGSKNLNFQMESYVVKRRTDGVHIINIRKTWEKILLAARAIVAIDQPGDVYVISNRQNGQRAVLKYASATKATPIAGRFTPGTFTNQSRSETFKEPRMLIVCDPATDHQPITEASYVNIPVIAFCNTDSPLRYVDIAIPCNNKGNHSIGLMWWLLAREVLRLRNELSRSVPWEIMVDMYFFREAEEQEKEEAVTITATAVDRSTKPTLDLDFTESAGDVDVSQTEWTSAVNDDWTAAPAAVPVAAVGAPVEDWSVSASTDWTA